MLGCLLMRQLERVQNNKRYKLIDKASGPDTVGPRQCLLQSYSVVSLRTTSN